MSLPESAHLQFAPDLRICRVLNGLWQVSGAHGRIDPQRAVPAMLTYHDAGFTTSEHIADNAHVFNIALDDEDRAEMMPSHGNHAT